MLDRLDRVASAISTTLRVGTATALALILVPPLTLGVAVVTLMYGNLPAGHLPDRKPQIQSIPSVVLDASGQQIGVFRRFDRTVPVTPAEIPDPMRQAIVAIEDQRFYQHPGIDLQGIARAARSDLEAGGVAQGGSTITQQYVKNVYLSREQTLERKATEALLALQVEKRMTKEEILYGYLTTAYFGEGAYGIGAAAQVYFNKPVSQLDISESAFLAGLVQAPSRLSPRNDLVASEKRRRMVLQALYDQGYLTPDQFEQNVARRLWFVDADQPANGPTTLLAARQPKGGTKYPYFVDWVEQQLLDKFGPDLVYSGGLRVETTLDPRLQDAAEAAVAKREERTKYPLAMALVSLEPSTGHVKAMVGGRDYAQSQVNLATGGTTGFQPGSSFKPFVLATAFTKGMGPKTLYAAPGSLSVPGCGGVCVLSNYDQASRPRMTLHDAMRDSINTVFAQLVMDVGVHDTVELARSMGLQTLDPDRNYGASLALGVAEVSPLQMASAYGTFANHGLHVEPTGILRVVDGAGNVLIDNSHPTGAQVISPTVADNVTDVLTDVVEHGTGRAARIERPAAGKTGTAQNYRAAWFNGYIPQLATSIWMGYADGQRSLQNVNGVRVVTGGTHPAMAWHDYMEVATQGLDVQEFAVPAPIVPLPRQKAAKADAVAAMDDPADGAEATPEQAQPQVDLGKRQVPSVLPSNCGGRPCQRQKVPDTPVLADPAPAAISG